MLKSRSQLFYKQAIINKEGFPSSSTGYLRGELHCEEYKCQVVIKKYAHTWKHERSIWIKACLNISSGSNYATSRHSLLLFSLYDTISSFCGSRCRSPWRPESASYEQSWTWDKVPSAFSRYMVMNWEDHSIIFLSQTFLKASFTSLFLKE